jgi:hypothetical protein
MKPPSPQTVEQRGHNARWQARAHRGQRVVEQESVRHLRAIIAGEPDLVHAVVETNDAVGRHHMPHVVHDTLRGERKAALVGPLGEAG